MSIREWYRIFQGRRKVRRLVKDTEEITGLRGKDASRIAVADLVDKTLENMILAGFSIDSMLRIVLNKSDECFYDLTLSERQVAGTLIGELACFKGVAQNGMIINQRILEKYAWTGYQRLCIPFDPQYGCVKVTYQGGIIRPEDFDGDALKEYLSDCGRAEFRKFSVEAWHSATADSPFARRNPYPRRVWFSALSDSLDPNKLRVIESMTDLTHRNVAPQKKREAIEAFLTELHARTMPIVKT